MSWSRDLAIEPIAHYCSSDMVCPDFKRCSRQVQADVRHFSLKMIIKLSSSLPRNPDIEKYLVEVDARVLACASFDHTLFVGSALRSFNAVQVDSASIIPR